MFYDVLSGFFNYFFSTVNSSNVHGKFHLGCNLQFGSLFSMHFVHKLQDGGHTSDVSQYNFVQ